MRSNNSGGPGANASAADTSNASAADADSLIPFGSRGGTFAYDDVVNFSQSLIELGNVLRELKEDRIEGQAIIQDFSIKNLLLKAQVVALPMNKKARERALELEASNTDDLIGLISDEYGDLRVLLTRDREDVESKRRRYNRSLTLVPEESDVYRQSGSEQPPTA